MPLFVSKGLGVGGLFQQVVERKKIPQVWASIIHTMFNRKTTCVHTSLLLLLSFLVLVLASRADDEEGGGGGGLSLMDILRGGTVGYPLSLNVAGRDEKLFNVHDFKSTDKSAEADDSGDYPGGPAKEEMLSDYTQAFQQAWRAACDFQGKARLVIPKGEYTLGQLVFSGPCTSASATTPLVIQLEGHLKAVTDLSRYSSPEWITFDTIDGLLITGGGTFDGQGQAAWGHNNCHANDNKCQLLACNIRFFKAKNTNIRQVTSLNSKGFHIVIFGSTNFRAYMLNIVAPEDSPNTDGIHVSNSSNIKISKSNIATGDDCISIYQGSSNIYVSSLTCGPGHGISVGSLGKHPNEKEVRGITVKNATLLNTTNGIRIKTWPGSPPGRAYAFTFADIIMKNVKNPIIIDQSYCASGNCKGAKTQKPSGIQISNVFYRNIKGTSATPDAISFVCSKTFPCKNVRLVDVDLTLSPQGQKGQKALASPVATCSCENADVRSIGRVNPRPACGA